MGAGRGPFELTRTTASCWPVLASTKITSVAANPGAAAGHGAPIAGTGQRYIGSSRLL